MDTQKIVDEILTATGWTQFALSVEIGYSVTMVSQLRSGARGKRPSFDLASKLLALHKKWCAPVDRQIISEKKRTTFEPAQSAVNQQ